MAKINEAFEQFKKIRRVAADSGHYPIMRLAEVGMNLFENYNPFLAVARALDNCRIIESHKVTREMRLKEDLDIDSLDVVKLSQEIENTLEVEICDEAVAGWRTVEDIVVCLTNIQNEK